MLGDLIFETQEKAIGTRILDEDGTVELSVQGKGTLLGIGCTPTLLGTSSFHQRPLRSSCQFI